MAAAVDPVLVMVKVAAEEVKARGYNLDIKNPHTVVDDHGDPAEWLA